jgi:hypothetical protein
VDVGYHCAGQSDGGGFVREDADDTASALEFFVEAFN